MKEKRFEGIKKKMYLIEKSKTFYQKGDVTVCAVQMEIPINKLFSSGRMEYEFLENIKKQLPDMVIYSNCWGSSRGFKLCVKGKSVCSPKDEYNEKLGKTIAYSRAQAKAYRIAARICALFASELISWGTHAGNVSEFFYSALKRENNFLDNI